MNKNSENNNDDINSSFSDVSSVPAIYSSSTVDISNVSQITADSGSVALDLVVIIDTSASMADESVDLSQQIDAAIQNASAKCPSQLRTTFLGIQGVWEGTKFNQSASNYLIAHGAVAENLQAREAFKEQDGKNHAGNKEDLCRAVIDVSKYFDWRNNARRAIFVLGDEGMEGGGGTLTNAAIAKNIEAISVAQNSNVKVYTYQGTPNDDPTNVDRFPTLADRDRVTQEYQRLAEQTGGRSYIYTTGIANFSLVLQEILCDSLTPPPPIEPPSEKSNCSNVCDQISAIISTVNTLASIIDKVIDSCCEPNSDHSSNKHHNSSKQGKVQCNCHH